MTPSHPISNSRSTHWRVNSGQLENSVCTNRHFLLVRSASIEQLLAPSARIDGAEAGGSPVCLFFGKSEGTLRARCECRQTRSALFSRSEALGAHARRRGFAHDGNGEPE